MDPATGSEDEIKSTVSNVDTAASVWTIQQVNAPSLDAIPTGTTHPRAPPRLSRHGSTGSPHALPRTVRADERHRCRPGHSQPSTIR